MIDSPPGNPVLQELAKALRGLEERQSTLLVSCHKCSVWCRQSGDDFTIRATSHKHSHHWGTLLGTSCGCKWSLLQRLLSVCLPVTGFPLGASQIPNPSFSHSLPPRVHTQHLESRVSICHMRDTTAWPGGWDTCQTTAETLMILSQLWLFSSTIDLSFYITSTTWRMIQLSYADVMHVSSWTGRQLRHGLLVAWNGTPHWPAPLMAKNNHQGRS